ncbi:fructose-1,6-bisphosphatase [Reichenbachiella agarivorans]|uniref:Fructose-1,6-bisphosphatase class 3 n=1 Tax=Reichenbachiella agarivorans TaxID=2979464 RepID=A0ABY6CPE1_9BACT|nr:fructose-1,6-bisphosphatase [Reichenbachiella agarivorans]UXP32239.1 fructose-1,6-bisphosphatase [Reichenbachiella agarivorans]
MNKALRLLSERFPDYESASTELLRLTSILELTKGTEVFVSDLHGSHETFENLIRIGFGTIEQIVDSTVSVDTSAQEKRELLSMIYYPQDTFELYEHRVDRKESLTRVVSNMLKVMNTLLGTYSMGRFNEVMTSKFDAVIWDLVNRNATNQGYVLSVIDNLFALHLENNIISDMAILIRKLSIQKLHVIGDIYDRGSGADLIVDQLIDHQECDVQWGNHDVVWMGAAYGSEACIANVLRVSLRYGNIGTLIRYGIHLIPLATFALKYYGDDPAIGFEPKTDDDEAMSDAEKDLNKIMHKAVAIIQFKLEGQLIARRPKFNMDSRLLLDKIDFDQNTIKINGEIHKLSSSFFPTIDPEDPYSLTHDEDELIFRLKKCFLESYRLQAHANFLFEKGGMYKVSNNNLFFHGCVPVDQDGDFIPVDLGRGQYQGKSLFDFLNQTIKNAWPIKVGENAEYSKDLLWYLWTGPLSPVFGKDKMATFERYFTSDQLLHTEKKNTYFSLRENEAFCIKLLGEFGLNSTDAIIINGHIPVSVRRGENPKKGNGKLMVIDGGFSKAYQAQTGIAGFTLIHDAWGRQLFTHLSHKEEIVAQSGYLNKFKKEDLSRHKKLHKVKDCPEGEVITERIDDLKDLLRSYQPASICLTSPKVSHIQQQVLN